MKHYAVSPGVWDELRPVIYGYEECEPEHSFGPAVRHYYLLHYVHEGEGFLEKNSQIHKVKAGDIFVIRPDEITTYGTGREKPWKYTWLGFTFATEIPALENSVLNIPAAGRIFTYIRDHCDEEDLDGKIYSLTYELVWRLSMHTHAKNGVEDYAGYAKVYLENAYMTDVSIQSIADSLHIDRRYLTRRFTQVFHVSPQAYLMQLRMDHAARFLAEGYPVSAVCRMVGFKDLPNFSRHFKKRYGISPSQRK